MRKKIGKGGLYKIYTLKVGFKKIIAQRKLSRRK
jgi:hypothetical protein